MASFKEHMAHVSQHGLSRTNRFQVLIPVPQKLIPEEASDAPEEMVGPPQPKSKMKKYFEEAVKVIRVFTGGGTVEFTRGLDLMCSQTELPGKTINISETKYNGDVRKMGNSIMYGNQQFVFRVSKDMFEKNIIDEWMNMIVNPETHEIGYYDDYVSNITVYQLDTKDEIMHAIMLEDAYPVMSNPLTLSNMEQNNTHELMVQFAYRRWKNVQFEEEKGGKFDSLLQTPLGPYISKVITNPLVVRGLDYVENVTGIDLTGEALNIYNQVYDVVESTTGLSIDKSVGLLNTIKATLDLNKNLTPSQITGLLDMIEGTVEKIKVD